MRPAKPSWASARSMRGRLRSDLVATRIGKPPASETRMSAFASKASRSTTASGADRPAVAAERRAATGCDSRRAMSAPYRPSPHPTRVRWSRQLGTRPRDPGRELTSPTCGAVPSTGWSADAVDDARREGLQRGLRVTVGQRVEQCLRLAGDGIRLLARPLERRVGAQQAQRLGERVVAGEVAVEQLEQPRVGGL